MAQSVVIIGAGITGSLLAWRLAKRGCTVTILEAQHVGAGSSSRTAAGIRQQFSTPATVRGMRFAVDFYRSFPQLVGGTEVPIVQNGYLFLYDREESWGAAKRRVQMQHAAGLHEVQALPIEALHAHFPWVDPLTVLGGSYCPTDGFLHPAVVYTEAIAAARRLGATLVQQAPVQDVRRRGERIEAVRTPKGDFEADVFVDATNAWSPRLGRVLQATELSILALKRYLWLLERGPSMSPETLLSLPLTIVPSGAYCRPENADRLLMGWAHDATPEQAFSYDDQDRIDPAFSHRTGTDTAAFETWATLAEVMPSFAEFPGIVATTSGYYGSTPDHNPFLDYDPLVPNLLRLSGFSGHGAMFGPFTALVGDALVAAGASIPEVEVLGERTPLAPFAIGRDFSGAEHMVI